MAQVTNLKQHYLRRHDIQHIGILDSDTQHKKLVGRVFSIMTLSIVRLSSETQQNDTQHNDTQHKDTQQHDIS